MKRKPNLFGVLILGCAFIWISGMVLWSKKITLIGTKETTLKETTEEKPKPEFQNIYTPFCDESIGEVLDLNKEKCARECSQGQMITECQFGRMCCVNPDPIKSKKGAFITLFVYNEDEETSISQLRNWIHSIYEYNERFNQCYNALIFFYGPSFVWYQIRKGFHQNQSTTKDFWPSKCLAKPMTYWIDISKDFPFEIPEQAQKLGVTKETVGSGCLGKANWPIAYTFMIRFRVWLMWDSENRGYWPMIGQYEMIFQLDFDCLLKEIIGDALEIMRKRHAAFGYYTCSIASASCTKGEWDWILNWLEKHGINKHTLDGTRKQLVMMGGMVLYDPHWIANSEIILNLLRDVDESGYVYQRRWPEHLFYTQIPLLVNRTNDVCFTGSLFKVFHNGKLFDQQTCPGVTSFKCNL